MQDFYVALVDLNTNVYRMLLRGPLHRFHGPSKNYLSHLVKARDLESQGMDGVVSIH